MEDGWLKTGDVGFMDEDGYVTIVDRKKDVINASGFNVYPKEIDELLITHPKILEVCTIGVPDAYRGETVKVFIVTKPGQTMTAEEVINFCKEKLAGYKVPKLVEFIAALPKSVVGKILRRELRDMEAKIKELKS
jgi:long-chain acyl-CoA synthetase